MKFHSMPNTFNDDSLFGYSIVLTQNVESSLVRLLASVCFLASWLLSKFISDFTKTLYVGGIMNMNEMMMLSIQSNNTFVIEAER